MNFLSITQTPTQKALKNKGINKNSLYLTLNHQIKEANSKANPEAKIEEEQ